jgi:putative addiction module component (TIGR02574 family)
MVARARIPEQYRERYDTKVLFLDEVVMAPALQELGLDQISLEDRLAVAEAIWESVALEIEAAPIQPAQREELERRLADSIARPEAVTPWEEIKARALARAKT